MPRGRTRTLPADDSPGATQAPTRPVRRSGRTTSPAAGGTTTAPTRPRRHPSQGAPRLTHQIRRAATFEAKYQIGHELGRGGMGLVRQAEDTALRRELAMKVLLDTRDESALAEFVDEAQITGQLEHPNIIPVYDLGVDPSDRPYMAMKLVRGNTLAQLVRELKARRARCTAADLQADGRLSVFAKVCDALAYAHSRGVIHRDLKPDNVMVGEFGEVLVMDWGLAKPVGAPEPGPAHRTAASAPVRTTRRESGHTTLADEVFGTPSYMAPEQAQGDVAAVDERSDVFALGGILYTLLTYELPYSGRDVHDVLAQAATHRLVPPRKRAPGAGIPKELDAVVMTAMAADPADRYASVQDLAADVTAFLAHQPMQAWRDGLAARAAKWVRRHPASAMTGGVSLLFVFLIGALLSLWMAQHEAQQREVQRLAAEQAESEAARIRAEQETREAELRRLAQARQFDRMAELLGTKVKHERDAAFDRYVREFEARPRDMTTDEWFAQWPEGRLDDTITAAERVLQASDAAGEQFYTANDFFFLGCLYANGKRDFRTALGHFSRAIELDPTDAASLSNRGWCKRHLGDPAAALLDIDAALQLDASIALLHMMRGETLLELDRHAEADAAMNRAIKMAPRFPAFRANRALTRLERGEFAAAAEDFAVAVELRPDNAGFWYELSRCRRAIGQAAQADADLDQAIRLDPDMLPARVERGNQHVQAGRMEAAAEDFAAALRIEPDNVSALVGRSGVRYARRDYPGALEDLNRALSQQPDYVPALYNRQRVRDMLGDVPGALADLDMLLELKPDDREAHVARGHLYGRQRQMQAAIKDFEFVIDAQPQDATTGDAHFQRSIARRALGDHAGADEDLDAAVRLAPRHPTAHLARGVARARKNDPDGALADLSRAIELDPTDYRAWFNRASILANRGETANAIRDLQQAWKTAPDPRVRQQIEQALAQIGGTIPD